MKTISLTFLIILMGVFAYGAEFPICTAAGDQQHPDVVFDGTEYTVVYDSVGDIWGAKVSTEGTVSERFVIVDDVNNSDTCPSIAYDGTNFFIAWLKEDNIYGIMIDANNNVVVNPFLIPFTNAHRYPKVTFNDTYYLVVGCGFVLIPSGVAGEIWGITYNTDGTVYHASFIIDRTSATAGSNGSIGNPSVGSDNDKFIVVYPWRNHPPGASTEHALKYKVVTADGQLPWDNTIKTVNDPNHTSHTIFYKYSSGVAFNGSEYFGSYHFSETASSSNGNYDVYGVRIDPTDGSIIQNNIQIAVQANVSEYASATVAERECYFVTWQDDRSTDFNIYGKHFDQNGDPFGGEVSVSTATNDQAIPKVAFDGINKLVAWQDYRNGSHWDIWGYLMPKIWTDDPLAMAYNGNRHLIRKQPNNETLHLIYTDNGKIIYRWSTNGGTDWTLPVALGNGEYPAMPLCSGDYTPAVAWTDDAGGLWYAKRQPELPPMWDVYHLYDPWGPYDPYLNSPPSISIVDRGGGNRWVHILVARTWRIQTNGVAHTIDDCSFPIRNPGLRTFTTIDQDESEPNNPCRTFPSIVKDDFNTLHGVWQRRDTVCYATKAPASTWSVEGDVFNPEGNRSAHPFVETYGDYVYVNWQRKRQGNLIEEVYKGWRHFLSAEFRWENMSQTPQYLSLYPVSAWGFFTVYTEEPSASDPYEIYYKVNRTDQRYNISQTPEGTSIYSHAAARFTVFYNYLYTAWLEGDDSPYEIRFERIQHSNPNGEMAYLTSFNGHNPSSSYLVARDGFMSDWQIPVDIGYETITYRFPLLPDYQYKLQAVAYHEASGEWREWVVIDNHPQHLIKYDAFEPETLEFWIPPAFYQDSVIEVTIERVAGDFATAGPIYVYRYEDEECGGGSGGGPMAKGSQPLNQGSLVLSPNPFTTSLQIAFQNQAEYPMSVKVYDITGRLVKNLHNGAIYGSSILKWSGNDENGRAVSQGIYFIRVDNHDSGETSVHKVLKIK